MANEQKANINLSMQNLPPEELDLQDRIKGFDKELRYLLGKYELGLAAMPRLSPDGRIVADPLLISARKKPAKDLKDVPAGGPKVPGGIVNPED